MDIHYHQAGDTVANLNMTVFEDNTRKFTAAVARCGTSFANLPLKGPKRRGLWFKIRWRNRNMESEKEGVCFDEEA